MKSFILKQPFSAFTIFGVIFTGLALYVFSLVIYEKIRVDLGGYDEVTGKVLQSYVKSHTISVGSKSRPGYYPVVKYSYHVSGIEYKASNRDAILVVSSSDGHGPGSRSDEVVSKYPRGAAIKVWYKINNPSVSVVNVKNEITTTDYVCILVFFIFGVLCFFCNRWS